MPVRNDHTPWTDAEKRRLAVLSAKGLGSRAVATHLNDEFHRGEPVRREDAIRLVRTKMGIYVAKMPKPVLAPKAALPAPATPEQEVEQKQTQDGTEARSVGTRIKTVEDLLRHINADLTRFEVEKSEATKYEVATKDPASGQVSTTELHRVFVRLRPKAGPTAEELVAAMLSGASFPRRSGPAQSRPKGRDANVLQTLVIADPHVGKYAWGEETGWQDYDVGIAKRLLLTSANELLADGEHRLVGRRAIFLLGDYFHYDTPDAKTTKGTALERDGRVEKMVEEGAAILFDIIEQAASIPTSVVLVPGNHDAMMTVALRHILKAYFRKDARVTIDDTKTARKYVTHGKVLLGLTHGDKAKKRLGELMPAEVPDLWGKSLYREWHTGHLHGEAEVQTVGGVVIRTAPALCPPDGWHSQEGYVAKPRGMQTFYYHAAGALLGMAVSNPDGLI